MAGSGNTLIVKTSTWNRDSHGLYDYECKSVIKRTFKSGSTSKVFRVGNECMLFNETSKLSDFSNA